jgi:hypothetical protein
MTAKAGGSKEETKGVESILAAFGIQTVFFSFEIKMQTMT